MVRAELVARFEPASAAWTPKRGHQSHVIVTFVPHRGHMDSHFWHDPPARVQASAPVPGIGDADSTVASIGISVVGLVLGIALILKGLGVL
jgi:hypothetical protein